MNYILLSIIVTFNQLWSKSVLGITAMLLLTAMQRDCQW